MSSKIGFVPLGEVNEYTDVLTVGNLGLPSGFDSDQLELHVERTIARARLAEVGHLSINGYRGDTTKRDFGVGGVSGQGVGTAVRSAIVTRAKIHQSEINQGETDGHGRAYKWLDARAWINNAEIEDRIKQDGDRWDKGLWDPAARAKYMDAALKGGILGIARQNTLGDDPFRTLLVSATLKYTQTLGCMIIFNALPGEKIDFISTLKWVAIYEQLYHLLSHGMNLAEHAQNRQGHLLPPRVWSLTSRKHYDRLALLHARMPMGALIRTAKV